MTRLGSRGLSEPGLGLPPRGASPRHHEHGVRRLAALVAVVLLAIVVWAAWPRGGGGGPAPGWSALAPPAEVPMRTWRWLVFSAAAGRAAHFALAPAPDGDPARIEVLPAWSLQRATPGYPEDAIVVALPPRAATTAIVHRAAELGAVLIGRIPTLAPMRAGTDRMAPPEGLDQERLRYLIREKMQEFRNAAMQE